MGINFLNEVVLVVLVFELQVLFVILIFYVVVKDIVVEKVEFINNVIVFICKDVFVENQRLFKVWVIGVGYLGVYLGIRILQ